MTSDDMDLVRQYAEGKLEEAFAALAERYVNLVYSTALRQVSDPHVAEEVTQAVFIILSRKAGSLGPKTILPSWLHRTAGFAAADALKTQRRRERREHEAHMQSLLNEPEAEAWTHIAPMLDSAIAGLSEKDRHAVVLRFFENKSLGEVGQAIGLSESAAKMRVNRSVDKLRTFFTKRGITLSAAVIAGAISANSIQAAPAGLAVSVSAAAKGAAVSGSTLTLVKGAIKIMAWTKMKMAMVVGAGILLAAGTTTVILKEISPGEVDDKWFALNREVLGKAPDNLKIIRPTHFGKPDMGGGMVGLPERIVGQNVPLDGELSFAHNFPYWNRIELPKDFPKNKFDCLFTLPKDQNDDSQDKVRSVMQDVIKRKLGFVAHRETRERDVLLLRIKNPNAAGLQKTVPISVVQTGTVSRREGLSNDNISMDDFAANLESRLAMPVLDRTGFTNHLDLDLKWNKRPGETQADTIKRAILDQLGLELVPSREPIEMLVVEKVK